MDNDPVETKRIPIIARVEGKGSLEITYRNDPQSLRKTIDQVRLRIFEPPRLFEKILEGREPQEVIDIVARICGICPAAYQVTAAKALESAAGISLSPGLQTFRRILTCGEWIESHSLHFHLLAAPDFLGYADVLEWAKHDPEAVEAGFRIHAVGNGLLTLLGGRSVHPVGVRVGGFHRLPSREACQRMVEQIREVLPLATALIPWAAGFDVPRTTRSFTSVSLRDPGHYPMNEGRIASDRGLDIPPDQFEHHIREFQVPDSTAFYSLMDGEIALVGPLARLNLNSRWLPPDLLDIVEKTGVTFPSANLWHGFLARAIEIRYALGEALRLLSELPQDVLPFVPAPPATGVAIAATEAPRGLLWHRYDLGEDGRVEKARIIPPTSQNQSLIEEDLQQSLLEAGPGAPEEEILRRSERIVRNYDPCISCATHFLKLTRKETPP